MSAQPAGEGNNDAVTYQWQSSPDSGQTWSSISGATTANYVVQESDENHLLRVLADSQDGGGNPISATSAATALVIDNSGLTVESIDARRGVGRSADQCDSDHHGRQQRSFGGCQLSVAIVVRRRHDLDQCWAWHHQLPLQ